MSVELLPCPFCGREARVVQSCDERVHFIIRCPSLTPCGEFVTACLGSFTNLWDVTPEEAAARWNTRAPLDKEAQR